MRWWILLAGVALAGDVPPGSPPTTIAIAPTPAAPATYHVIAVHDGDTFTLANGDKVRLKWANTPEIRPPEPYSEDAQRWTSRLVLDNDVTLDIDGAAPRDGYGRVLAAAHIGDVDLSISLLEQGYAHVYLIPPIDGDPAPYIAAQEKARAANLGIWSTDRYSGPLHITSYHANGIGDETLDPNKEYLRVCNITGKPFDMAGYRIQNAHGDSWTFPSLIVPAGNTVAIHSGRGGNNADPSQQLTLFLGSQTPIWDNTYDKAVILAPDGSVVDAVEYHGKGN
jgi:endonuclease YncB( thermonuclease family)